jgi:hypothetical protein
MDFFFAFASSKYTPGTVLRCTVKGRVFVMNSDARDSFVEDLSVIWSEPV